MSDKSKPSMTVDGKPKTEPKDDTKGSTYNDTPAPAKPAADTSGAPRKG